MTTAAGSGRTKQQQSRRSGQSAKQSEKRPQQSSTQTQSSTQRSNARRSSTQQASTQQANTRQANTQQANTQQASTQRARDTQQGHDGDHGATVDLPFVTAHFHVPEIHLPTSTQDFSSAADSVRAQLPSREHSLFYGGLALGTAFAFIEWPVALAIGVGHALLNRPQQETTPSATSA